MATAHKGGSGKVMVAMVVAGDEQAWWQARLAKNGECMIMVMEAHGMESSSIGRAGMRAWQARHRQHRTIVKRPKSEKCNVKTATVQVLEHLFHWPMIRHRPTKPRSK